MRTLAKSLTLALTAAGLAGTMITPALAETPAPAKAVVSFADLDLATTAGQRTLDQRIARAVRDVCRTTSVQTGSRILSQDAQNCLTRARAQAKQQVAALIPDAQRGG